MAFRNITNIDATYRGWYDPVQKLVSIQFPSRHYIPGATYTEEDVPDFVLQALNRKFPNANMKVF
jgi:hypothetical protein